MSPVSAFSIRQGSDYYELHGPTQSADHAVPSRPPESGSADVLDEDYSHSSQTGETEGSPFAPPQPEPFEVVEPVDQTDNGPVGVQATTSVEETGNLPEVLAERYEVRESIGGWSVQDREIDDVAEVYGYRLARMSRGRAQSLAEVLNRGEARRRGRH